MIKTQTKDECVFLRNILGRYYSHIMDHADTLITRFYGMYRVKMKHIRKTIHFVVMASVFDTPLPIHLQFDLKVRKHLICHHIFHRDS
jgi:1-phosphatidylinositol-4-phosphate 5-kinase